MIRYLTLSRGWKAVAIALSAGVLASCGADAGQTTASNPTATAEQTAETPAGGATTVTASTVGLKEGDRVSAFDVNDITGPKKGKQLCYV